MIGKLDQRFYTSQFGRFLSADRFQQAAKVNDSGSWNKYSYTRGDPVNRVDRRGLFDGPPDALDCIADDSLPGCGDDSQDGDGEGQQTSTGLPAQPTCDSVLTANLTAFLQSQAPSLLKWDPNLASDLVAEGQAVGIDPRLFASIGALESGNGGSFKGNNPFGLGPGNTYSTPWTGIQAEGATVKKFVYSYGEGSVSALYSGNGFIVVPKQPWKVVQYPAYCYGATDTEKAKCQAAGGTVSTLLSGQAGSSSVGLAAGNPNNLAFPCPK